MDGKIDEHEHELENTHILINDTNARVCAIEYATKSSVLDCMHELETRVETLENFLKKIMPMLPDEIKLYLELAEDEGEH